MKLYNAYIYTENLRELHLAIIAKSKKKALKKIKNLYFPTETSEEFDELVKEEQVFVEKVKGSIVEYETSKPGISVTFSGDM